MTLIRSFDNDVGMELLVEWLHLKEIQVGSCCRGTVETNLTKNHKLLDWLPDLAQWVKGLALLWAVVQAADVARIPSCCGCGVELAAIALIKPLAWERPYAEVRP